MINQNRSKIIHQIITSKLFWSGLLIKLSLAYFFASDFLTHLFIPFVNHFATNSTQSPYQYFVTQNNLAAFPYPALMLYILAAPRIIFGGLVEWTQNISLWNILIIRTPLLLFDLAILLVLCRWLRSDIKKVIIFYWLSPVLIYISFIHGQLDVIAIGFLFISLYFLFKEKSLLSFAALGLSIASKSNIILALPFFLFFLIKQRKSLLQIILNLTTAFAVFLLANIQFIFDSGFYQMVFNNKVSLKIFDSFLILANNKIFYFVPAAYLLLLLKGFLIKNYNKNIFVMLLGFAFGIISIFIPPMPGWYFWILPFFIYFNIKNKNHFYLLLLQAAYFCYFLIIPNSDFPQILQIISPSLAQKNDIYNLLLNHGFNADLLVNISFTGLQTLLLVNCLLIYRDGIDSYSKHKITSKPYLLGICGDSASGKTIVSNFIKDIFGSENTTIIHGDDMHKWERGNQNWQNLTHLNPSANELHQEINFLRALKDGQKISRRHYDHNCGKFTEEKTIYANKLVIFEGLHSFYIKQMRDLYDLKIFIKPNEILRQNWKVKRDQENRGHSQEKILQEIDKRKDDGKKFISSQEKYADIIIEILPKATINDSKNIDVNIGTYLKFTITNIINLEILVNELNLFKSLKINHYHPDEERQILEIDGNISSDEIDLINNKLLKTLEEININNPKWNQQNRQFSLIQLIITYCIIWDSDNGIK